MNLFQNGDEYVGRFANGQINGHGVFSWADGRKYDGNFVKGKPHGNGMMTYLPDDPKFRYWGPSFASTCFKKVSIDLEEWVRRAWVLSVHVDILLEIGLRI